MMLTAAGAIALSAWAGPFLQQRAGPSDSDRSLAGLKRVEVIVEELPPQFRNVGVTAELLRTIIANDLEAAGHEIIETKRVAKLGVQVSAVTDSYVPGGIAYSVNMVLYQTVKIERLDQALFVPTHNQVILGLEVKHNLSESLKTTVRSLTREWVEVAQLVTEERH